MLLNSADNIYLGSESVDKVYLGNTLVWPMAPEYYKYFNYTTTNGQVYPFMDQEYFNVYDEDGNFMAIRTNTYDGVGKVDFDDAIFRIESSGRYMGGALHTLSFLPPVKEIYLEYYNGLSDITYTEFTDTLFLSDLSNLRNLYLRKNLKFVSIVRCTAINLTFQSNFILHPDRERCRFSTNSVEELSIPEGNRVLRYFDGTNVNGWSVDGSRLTKVYIPSTVEFIDNTGGCLIGNADAPVNLTDIYCYAPTAPVIQDSTWRIGIAEYLPEGGTLHCPVGSDYSSWNRGEIASKHWNIVYDL